MAKTNYHQKRRQKELSRKARQDEKQQRRLTRTGPEGVPAAEPADDSSSTQAFPATIES